MTFLAPRQLCSFMFSALFLWVWHSNPWRSETGFFNVGESTASQDWSRVGREPQPDRGGITNAPQMLPALHRIPNLDRAWSSPLSMLSNKMSSFSNKYFGPGCLRLGCPEIAPETKTWLWVVCMGDDPQTALLGGWGRETGKGEKPM